jgi:hypothetical protein
MNGRVYDPVLGRFLSPDPVVQAPHDAQSWNRYSYVRNNPLRYTDPTGFVCFNGHPAADYAAESCLRSIVEQVFVQASRLSELMMRSISDLTGVATSQAGYAAAGSVPAGDLAYAEASTVVPAPPVAALPEEEVVVTATRLSDPLPAALDASMYAPAPTLGDMLTAATVAIALIEPTPVGEIIVAERALETGGKALSTIRYTQPGETFLRYESSDLTFSRVTLRGGVRSGTYAAPKSDGLIPLTNRPIVYNLPDPAILRTEVYYLNPPPRTLIVGPRPVMGGTGNEVLFPWGFQ